MIWLLSLSTGQNVILLMQFKNVNVMAFPCYHIFFPFLQGVNIFSNFKLNYFEAP